MRMYVCIISSGKCSTGSEDAPADRARAAVD